MGPLAWFWAFDPYSMALQDQSKTVQIHQKFSHDSVDTLIKRLETPPINLSPTLINTIDAEIKEKEILLTKLNEKNTILKKDEIEKKRFTEQHMVKN